MDQAIDEVPRVRLRTGAAMPQLGFGVFKVPPEETVAAVTAALRAGYRSIDTAAYYRNEAAVGEAIRAAGVPRDELFVTTKVWHTDHGRRAARAAAERSLAALGLEHVDLLLIHWPAPARDRYVETWHALEALHREGRARAIGVSNFAIEHLERLLREGEVMPAVNQVELHPWLAQAKLREFHARHGIVTEAWAPLAQGGELLREPAIARIAAAYGRTPAQVVLRWHLQLGHVAIPKSVTPARIAENLDVFGFELDGGEMAAIGALDRGRRLGPDPAVYGA